MSNKTIHEVIREYIEKVQRKPALGFGAAACCPMVDRSARITDVEFKQTKTMTNAEFLKWLWGK